MSKSFKVAAIAVVTVVVLAMPVFAQINGVSNSPAELKSNQLRATAEVFTGDVDDSMDVRGFSGVLEAEGEEESAKWQGFLGYGGSSFFPISVGYARNLGSIYLGTWYTGGIIRLNGSSRERTAVQTQYDLASQAPNGNVTTTTTYGPYWINSNNQIEALIGLTGLNMGFKVGFWESLAVNKSPVQSGYVTPNDSVITTTKTVSNGGAQTTYLNEIDEDFSRVYGTMMPSLVWGMNLDAGSITIAPQVSASLGIFKDNQSLTTKNYTTVLGQKLGDESFNYRDGFDNGYLEPQFALDVNIGISPNASIDIGYGIGFKLYNNDYDASGISGSAEGAVSWSGSKTIARSMASVVTETNASLSIDEASEIAHSISLGFAYEKELIENELKLGTYISLPVSISSSSSETYDRSFNTAETKYLTPDFAYMNQTVKTKWTGASELVEVFELNIAPEVAIGASYALFPGRFTINAGIALRPFTFTRTSTTTSVKTENSEWKREVYDGNGNLISSVITRQQPDGSGGYVDNTSDKVTDKVRVQDDWDYFDAGVYAGFVFNFNKNAAVELYAGNPDLTYGRWLDITNLNVLFTFKF